MDGSVANMKTSSDITASMYGGLAETMAPAMATENYDDETLVSLWQVLLNRNS